MSVRDRERERERERVRVCGVGKGVLYWVHLCAIKCVRACMYVFKCPSTLIETRHAHTLLFYYERLDHTNAHAHMHRHTCTHINTHTHTHTHTNAHAHMHTYMQ